MKLFQIIGETPTLADLISTELPTPAPNTGAQSIGSMNPAAHNAAGSGSTTPQGVQGAQGATGSQGAQGLAGSGAQGAQGVQDISRLPLGQLTKLIGRQFEVPAGEITITGAEQTSDGTAIDAKVLGTAVTIPSKTLVGATPTSEGLRNPKDNPCWKGYKPVGTKKKASRTVPNCVPKTKKKSKQGVAEGNLDPSGLVAAASMVRDFIITAEVDGKTNKFCIRGMTGANAAKDRFLKHHSMAKVLDVSPKEGVAEGEVVSLDQHRPTEMSAEFIDWLKTNYPDMPLAKLTQDPAKRNELNREFQNQVVKENYQQMLESKLHQALSKSKSNKMKIQDLKAGYSIAITNEEREFIRRHPRTARITALDDRDQWIAQHLVRKGVYEMDDDDVTLINNSK